MLDESEVRRLADAFTCRIAEIERTGRGNSPEGVQLKRYVEAFESVLESGQDPRRLHRLMAIRNESAPAVIDRSNARVSIVIAARNNAQFLKEAIESALSQTIPCEVIYSDDCSTDESVSIARGYQCRGLVVLTTPVHLGVAAVRHRGFAVAKGEWFLNLDGDDILPKDYVARMLAAVAPNCPFIYGAAQGFGEGDTLWDAPAWGSASLWVRNFVNTSALYSRTAYFAAGGWRETMVGTMWDWDLALRASRFGMPRKSQATLMYRLHKESFSSRLGERTDKEFEKMAPAMRRANLRISVGCLMSGRLPKLLEPWMARISNALNIGRIKGEFVFLVHAPVVLAFDFIHARMIPYQAVRAIPFGEKLRWESELERRDKVAELLASACNRLKAEMTGDVHWIVEDDILPPVTAARDMLDALTAGVTPPAAVTGCYRNRHTPASLVGGFWRGDGPVELTEVPAKPLRVDFAGTGCLMYWKDRAPDWKSHYKSIAAHDWYWGMELAKRGEKQIMLPDVRCGHAVSDKEILEC